MALLGLGARITMDIAAKVVPRLQGWRNTKPSDATPDSLQWVATTMRLSWPAAKQRALLRSTSLQKVRVVVSRPESSPLAWSLCRWGLTPLICPRRIRLGP